MGWEERKNGVRRSRCFPQNASINRDHFRDFGAYRPVPDTLARLRIGWPWACNAGSLSFFPPRRKATAAKARVNVRTYVRSVPLREDTTDSVPSKGVSFRVVSGASVTPGVVPPLPARSACLYSVNTHVTHGEMRSTLRNVHRAQVALLSLGEYEIRMRTRDAMLAGLVVRSCARANRRIHASVAASEPAKTRKSGYWSANLAVVLRRKDTVGCSYTVILYDWHNVWYWIAWWKCNTVQCRSLEHRDAWMLKSLSNRHTDKKCNIY